MPRIFGQERAIESLNTALASGRFHHAWIFSGPKGVGKLTTALAVARVLLVPPSDEPTLLGPAGTDPPRVGEIADPNSRVQKMIDAGTHPDLHVIRKELALYSEDRKLRERKLLSIPLDLLRERMLGGRSSDDAPAYRTAALGHGKVFIIDEAELLDPVGQNALLKTLEEPPAQTWFFLITSQPDRLIPTIRSRCQHVRFSRLEAGAMDQWWQAESRREPPKGAEEGRGGRGKREVFDPRAVSAQALKWSLAYADGSPGMALLAMEYRIHDWQQALDPMLREIDAGEFPTAMGEMLGRIVEEFAQAWVARHGKDSTSKDAANKDGARLVLGLLATHARRRLAETVARRDAGHMIERWTLGIDLVRECERQIESNVNQKLAMENLVAQWSAALSGAIAV